MIDNSAYIGKKCEVCRVSNRNGIYVLRTNHKTQQQFIGCSEYPECVNTMPILEPEQKEYDGYDPDFFDRLGNQD